MHPQKIKKRAVIKAENLNAQRSDTPYILMVRVALYGLRDIVHMVAYAFHIER